MKKWEKVFAFPSILLFCRKRHKTLADETLYLLYKHFPFTLAKMFASAIGQDRTQNNTEKSQFRTEFLKCTLPHNNAYKVQ